MPAALQQAPLRVVYADPEHNLASLAEAVLIFSLFFAAGTLTMLPATRAMLAVWTSDPLRSFGSLLPLVSLALIVRAWRSTAWQFDTHPAGLPIILLAIAAARASDGLLLSYRIGSLSLYPLQPALMLFLFANGTVLLLGGTRLWKRSAFALGLLLCVNPVPHFFTTWVDFPLQRASADVARSFAHLLGLYPTGQQLQLMFTPQFGMEIIPGCNGMRGAATMAYLTLILAYLRNYRPLRIAALTVAAAALGYVLNFLRLCLLVVYYAIGINHPHLRGDGALIDYIIGGCLFLIVGTLAGAVWSGHQSPATRIADRPVDWPRLLRRPVVLVTLLLLLPAAVVELPAAYALARNASPVVPPERAFRTMPETAGPWTRANTYSMEVLDGVPHWVWANYHTSDGRSVDLGIWLMPFQHFALKSRQVHGVEPDWSGSVNATAAHNVPVQLSAFVARDDVGTDSSITGYYEETTCLVARCSTIETGFRRQGWSVATGPAALRTTLRLPVQFRVLHPGQTAVSPAERATDQALMRDLLSQLDTAALTQTLGFR